MSDRFYLGGEAPAWADGYARTGAELREIWRRVCPAPPLKLWIAADVPVSEMEGLFPDEHEWPRFEDFGHVVVGDTTLRTCDPAELRRVWGAEDSK